ncbi:hypothetical protein NE236_36975 [Actinoallomurus purpureus]|uniref:hypothetical protein n=1 Tax=Actinoallomurus purpureus TaxID=478114 RepID=UPI00209381FC|nr:hypothetical protein [Actinoallomurus purpureus]MCO6010567.1 hypothetical protein [Actinoallomurus purpureus]
MQTLLLASGDHASNDTGSLILLVLFALVLYGAACAIWPFRSCRTCGGSGRFRSPSGRAWRYCRRCNGTGAKLRLGRRILTYLANTRDRGTRGHRD